MAGWEGKEAKLSKFKQGNVAKNNNKIIAI